MGWVEFSSNHIAQKQRITLQKAGEKIQKITTDKLKVFDTNNFHQALKELGN